jgi:hypothetical protein
VLGGGRLGLVPTRLLGHAAHGVGSCPVIWIGHGRVCLGCRTSFLNTFLRLSVFCVTQCVYTCMYTCMYICMYTCMCVNVDNWKGERGWEVCV